MHLEFDLLVTDVHSLHVAIRDLGRLYARPECALPPVGMEFPEYLRGEQLSGAAERDRAREYWQRKPADLPPRPGLPTVRSPERIGELRFVRHQDRLEPTTWRALVGRARDHGVTPAVALATAFAETVGRWSAEPRFLLNVPTFNRRTRDPAVLDVVGDLSNFVVVAVDLTRGQSFAGRCRMNPRGWR